MEHKSFPIISILILSLAACSHLEGVERTLLHESELRAKDFSCLNQALKSEGYNARSAVTNTYENKKTTAIISYRIKESELGHSYDVTLGGVGHYDITRRKLGSIDSYNEPIEGLKKLVHGISDSDSEPKACADLKSAVSLLVEIEDKIFPICNLVVARKPQQKVPCQN